jgi:hypothetical protein
MLGRVGRVVVPVRQPMSLDAALLQLQNIGHGRELMSDTCYALASELDHM